MKKIIFLLIAFSLNSFAGNLPMEAAVTVNPVGDFTATAEKLTGFAVKDGDGFKAEDIHVSMVGIKTGMKLRDEHTGKYLESDKFPEAVLVKAIGKGGKGVAKIKFHGVEKEVRGTYSVEGETLIANFPLSLKEFGISKINFKGAGVNDEVKVTVRVPIKK